MTLRQGYLLSLESFIDVINKKEKTQITKFTNGLECYDPLELRIEYLFLSNQINARGTGKLRNEKKRNETKRKQNPTKSVK
jgi:hypothetical protein